MNMNEYKMMKQYREYYAAYNSGRRQHEESKPEVHVNGKATWSEQGVNQPTILKAVK